MATERYQPHEAPRAQEPHRPPAPHSRDNSQQTGRHDLGREPRSPAGHRRDHRDLPARGDRRVQPLREPHVLLADVDVYEPAQLAGVVQDPPAEARVVRVQPGDDVAQRSGLGADLCGPAGVAAQDGGNADRDAHSRPALLNASRVGRIGAGARAMPATASSVFRPSPELMMTVSASGSSRPEASSFLSTPTTTPPAVSAKIPSVAASRPIASTISSSDTSAIAPPVRRTVSSTYGPSAGSPIASDLAIVAGRTGRTTSWPASNAADTGAHPLACAPNTRQPCSPTRPSAASSRKPLSTLT